MRGYSHGTACGEVRAPFNVSIVVMLNAPPTPQTETPVEWTTEIHNFLVLHQLVTSRLLLVHYCVFCNTICYHISYSEVLSSVLIKTSVRTHGTFYINVCDLSAFDRRIDALSIFNSCMTFTSENNALVSVSVCDVVVDDTVFYGLYLSTLINTWYYFHGGGLLLLGHALWTEHYVLAGKTQRQHFVALFLSVVQVYERKV